MFSCIIFDFDMTLVDSSYAIRDTMNKIAERKGLPLLTREDVLSVVGMPIRDSWHKLWGRFEEQWLEEFRALFLEQEFAGIVPFPGTKRVLEALSSRGVPLGVASNRQRPAHPLKAVGLEGFFDSVVGMDDVPAGKPAPDMLLKGVAQLGGTPETALYVGDTVDDMTAAKDAGMRSVGLTTGTSAPEALAAAGAWKVFGTVDEVLSLFETECGHCE